MPAVARLRQVASAVGTGNVVGAGAEPKKNTLKRLAQLSAEPAAAGGTPAAAGFAVSPDMGKVDGPFSDDDLRFWEKNGYVVLPNAVPQENLQAVIDDVFSFLTVDPDDPESMYKVQEVHILSSNSL